MSRAVMRGAIAVLVVIAGACSGGDDDDGAEVDVATTVVATTALPTTAAAPTTAAPATTDAPSTTAAPTTVADTVEDTVPMEIPPIDPTLAERVPAVEGFTTVADEPDPMQWGFYDVPEGLSVYPAAIVAADGTEVGRLIVAAASDESRPPIESYIESVFTGPVEFLADTSPGQAGETIALVNTSFPSWTGLADGAVITASVPEQDIAQWAWGGDGLLWIVRGRPAAQAYVAGLVGQHVAALDPHDHMGLIGDLFDHTPVIDGYTYLDFPRSSTLASLPSGLPMLDCFERGYLGYVRPEGEPITPMEDTDLGIGIVRLAEGCLAEGVHEQLVATLDADPRWTLDEVGGVEVRRDASNLVYVGDDVVIQLSSEDPATLSEMGGFIVPFLQNQPA